MAHDDIYLTSEPGMIPEDINEEPSPSVKTNWVAYVVDGSDKIHVCLDNHDYYGQRESMKKAGNKIVGYIYDTKQGAIDYGQWLLAHPPTPRGG